jgi:hypothetical protein
MDSILIDAARFRLSSVLEDIEYYYNVLTQNDPGLDNKEIRLYEEIADQELFDIDQITYPFPKVVYEHVKNALVSYLLLLKPPKESIVDKIKEAKKMMERAKKFSHEQAKEEKRWYPSHFTCLLDAYQEYLTKLT